jgi:hypothetical protein
MIHELRPAVAGEYGDASGRAGMTRLNRLAGHGVADRPRGARHWRSVTRPAGLLALAACLLLALVFARPAGAEPSVPSVPDAGARPPSIGPLETPPGASTGPAAQTGPPALGPLAQQIRAETAAVQALAEQLKLVEAESRRLP